MFLENHVFEDPIYIFSESGSLTDYLLAWIENQSRTPNDRCAFEHNIWPIRTEKMSGFTEISKKNKNLWLCPATEDEEIKLFTTQQNFVMENKFIFQEQSLDVF